jgi:drug/metabolite transporter (DMT)-like permease
MLGGMLVGHLILRDRVPALRWMGAAVMAIGLVWLMVQGADGTTMPRAWFGDLLFVFAGLLWTSYTFMLKRWNAEPVTSVAAVNVISGIAYLPVYLIVGHGHVPHASVGWMLGAAAMQGIVAAFLTVYAYAQSVRLLGASRAAVLPAMVPPVALIIGALALHDIPSLLQTGAVGIAMIGFAGAVGAWPKASIRVRSHTQMPLSPRDLTSVSTRRISRP